MNEVPDNCDGGDFRAFLLTFTATLLPLPPSSVIDAQSPFRPRARVLRNRPDGAVLSPDANLLDSPD